MSLPKGKYLDVIIAEQHFSFETDTSNFVKNIKITGSKENELFFSFQQQMAQRITQLRSLDAQARTQNANAAQALKKAQDELKQYQTAWLAQHQQTLVAKIIKASQEPDIPTYPKPVPNQCILIRSQGFVLHTKRKSQCTANEYRQQINNSYRRTA